MAFVEPRYTRSKVNWAGETLLRPMQTYRDIERQIEAGDVLSNWRAAHAYPINTFQATLRHRLGGIDGRAIVAQRLKRTVSIVEKLRRYEGMRLARMQDIGGLRAVVASVAKARQLEELYRGSKWTHELTGSKDYIARPKSDGYRGVHLIFRYRNPRVPAYDNLSVELQIRTRTQHEWATAVETMGTFLGVALKAGQGDAEWRSFFAASSAAFARLEGQPAVPGYEHMSPIETYREVALAESRLNVLHRLEGFSVATERIFTMKGQGSYHLIALDSRERSVSIQPYPVARLAEAEEAYAQLARRAEDGEQIDAVLVAAGPIEKLRIAYPNYFLDTQGFIRRISRVIERGS